MLPEPRNIDVQDFGERITVLILEDEEDARWLIASTLKKEGYHILEARHPHDALDIAESGVFAVDIMIVDIMLPDMSGDQFAREMLSKHPFLKIIFATALDEKELEGDLARVPYTCFLQKPFTAEALREAVRITLAA